MWKGYDMKNIVTQCLSNTAMDTWCVTYSTISALEYSSVGRVIDGKDNLEFSNKLGNVTFLRIIDLSPHMNESDLSYLTSNVGRNQTHSV